MNLPSRILIVNWQDIKNPQAGGAELHLHEVAKRMIQNGMQCILYVSRFKGAPTSEVIDGIEIYRRGVRWNFNFVVWLSIRKWIRLHNPDLVIDDSNKIPFLLPWLCAKPVLVRIHHLFRTTIFREASFLTGLYVYALEFLGIRSWRKCSVVTVSPSTQSELISLGVPRVRVALNGVDGSQYFKSSADEKQNFNLLYLGRIKKYKGIDTLIDSVLKLQNKFPEVKLIIAGEGDDLPRLREKVKDISAQETVIFKGYVKDSEKRKLYNQAVLLLNSSHKEGYGLTTIEANACGTPVIAADVPGLRDSIKNGETGFLVPYGSTEDFCLKIERFFLDSKLREKMQNSSLAWAAMHTWEKTYTETVEAIKEI